jgi:serine/threonine protein phosphatase PrpC
MRISLGQHSERGRKEVNQDFHGACVPAEPLLSAKGVAIALADGISTSNVSGTAAEVAVKTFLEDYFCTSEAWSVRKSAQRVLMAANSWLHAQTQGSQYRFDKDRGYVCTLSALVMKGRTAHLFHVGDTRVYRVNGHGLEQITTDHRVWVSREQSHLSRALGVDGDVEIDHRALPLDEGDTFLLATDGVYEHAPPEAIAEAIQRHAGDLDAAARRIVAEAYERGSGDNLTVQIVRVDGLPRGSASEARGKLAELPFAPLLEPRMSFEGYQIVRELHASPRSHLYLALDEQTQTPLVIKTPSIDLRDDPAYLERFLMEEWIAQRIDSPFVAKPRAHTRARGSIYIAMEYIEGRTLAQWMIDNPRPELEPVRALLEQIARGLTAFHRLEMLHQDIRPQNIMIDASGTAKIVDFGSTRVAGVVEMERDAAPNPLPGTAAYMAPEYFLGESGTPRSDLFSLGVIAYHMLCGKLPYGTDVAKCRSREEQRNLTYHSLLDERRDIPPWIDEVLRRAVHPDPLKRYEDVSEFTYDLRHPNPAYLARTRPPLIERNPVTFWKGVSLLLALILAALLVKLAMR